MLVKRLDAVVTDKPRKEKCEGTDENKKNTGQNQENYVELQDVKKIKVLNTTCLENGLDNQMLTSNKLVGSKPDVVLREIVYSGVIVKRHLVKKEQLTGEVGYVMTVARTLLKAPFANVEVSTPYFNGIVTALCLKDPLYELIIENISVAKASEDPDGTW